MIDNMALQYTTTQLTQSMIAGSSTQQHLTIKEPQQNTYDQKIIMWASTNQQVGNSEMTSDDAPAMIVSPPSHNHCGVTAPAYSHLNRNRSWMSGPPSSWSTWKYPTFYQHPSSGSAVPMVHSIGRKDTAESQTHGDCISPTSPSPSKKQKQSQYFRTDEEHKRQLYLVKNRQAASKCRQRKKEWIAHMQETLTSFTAENDMLQQQVMMLREEVLRLKTLLVMCKDCPQAQANGVYGLESSSTNGRCI